MVKKGLLILAFLASITLSASAQPASNDDDSNEGWNTFYCDYNLMPVSYDKHYGDDYPDVFHGFSFGYSRAISLSPSIPIFLEPGIATQFSFGTKTFDYDEGKETHMLLSMKVPINVLYKFSVANNKIDLIPYSGLTVRGNIWGQGKWDPDDDDYFYDDDDETWNLFDKDDMGDDRWKRVQIGWQVGFKARFVNRILVGTSYGSDFNKYSKHSRFNSLSLTFGLTF